MKLKQCLLGQIISVMTVLKLNFHSKKHDKLNLSAPFFIDVLITPIILFVACILLKNTNIRKIEARVYFGCFLDAFINFLQTFGFESKFYMEYESGFLAFDQLSYMICLIFTYLVTDSFPKKFAHLMAYFILLATSIVLVNAEKSIYIITLDHFVGFSGMFSMLSSAHYMLTNIITNESGILNYLILRSPFTIIMCIVTFWSAKSEDIQILVNYIKFNWAINTAYTVLSLLTFLGTIVFIQKFGVVSTAMISISTFIIHRFMMMLESGVFRFFEMSFYCLFYIVFICTG